MGGPGLSGLTAPAGPHPQHRNPPILEFLAHREHSLITGHFQHTEAISATSHRVQAVLAPSEAEGGGGKQPQAVHPSGSTFAVTTGWQSAALWKPTPCHPDPEPV